MSDINTCTKIESYFCKRFLFISQVVKNASAFLKLLVSTDLVVKFKDNKIRII